MNALKDVREAAHSLFDLVHVRQNVADGSAGNFGDFTVTALPAGQLTDFPRAVLERIVG